MEHIVQFAIGIDDDAIVNRVTQYAENQLIGEIKKEVHSNIEHEIFEFDRSWYSDKNKKTGLQDWVEKLVNDLLEQNKEQIIEMAAVKLADKMSRSKIIRETMTERFVDIMDDVK